MGRVAIRSEPIRWYGTLSVFKARRVSQRVLCRGQAVMASKTRRQDAVKHFLLLP